MYEHLWSIGKPYFTCSSLHLSAYSFPTEMSKADLKKDTDKQK